MIEPTLNFPCDFQWQAKTLAKGAFKLTWTRCEKKKTNRFDEFSERKKKEYNSNARLQHTTHSTQYNIFN